ncbi:MAG TPA: sugar ABC transporter substrate-binding protein [Actinomycetota bacterium]|nr:sugar ABC transporter substrate-binding protein [Actinomycetota bacterium]
MKNPVRLFALLATVVLAVSACTGTGGDPEQPSPGGPVSGQISLMVFGEPEEIKAYRALIDGFKQAEPGVTVNLIETSDREDLIARFSTGFAAGTPPDLFLLNYRFYGQFAARGVLEPLQGYLDSSREFEEGDFYQQAMEAFKFDGRQTCMPQNISSLVVYYNKDLFAEAGIDEPTAGWTWDDMREAAHSLTRDLNGDGEPDQYGVGVEPSIIRIAPFVWSNGGNVVDNEQNPSRLTLDTPQALEAMQQFFDLRQVDLVAPGEEEVESEDLETRFLNGTMAMLLESRRATPTLRTITDFDWDVAPLPRHQEPAGILHSDAYCLTRASENKAAAWRFIEFALGPQGAPLVAETGRTVPSLRSVAESEAFLDPTAKPRNSRVFLDTIPVIRRVPTISTWPEIEDVAEGILEGGFFEGVDVEDVARQLNDQTREIFARAE